MDDRGEFLNRRMDILIETNVPVAVRDGVRLATDVHR
jgi:predicted acyl esterase